VFVLAAGAPIQIAISAVAASDCLAPNLLRKRRVPIHVPPHTEIVDYEHGDAPGLTVRGEIDIATSPELALALDRAILASIGAFVLDLRELEFLDSSGLHVVLQARTALADQARQLAIVCPPGPVRRVMEVACVDHCLLLVDAPADVAAALDPAE
jgi:anti-sigma B factor antagonist